MLKLLKQFFCSLNFMYSKFDEKIQIALIVLITRFAVMKIGIHIANAINGAKERIISNIHNAMFIDIRVMEEVMMFFHL